MDKKNDFVNGMGATVQHYDIDSQCLEVITETGKRLAVHLRTENRGKMGRITCFPVRLGYAGTIHKVQGATVKHITAWLDRPGCRAAGYVALSRIRNDADYLIAGKVTPRTFTPAM